jgi:GNAT superfamily N-acetyltransferase
MLDKHPFTTDQLRSLYDQDQRINFSEPGVRREATPHTVRQINLRQPESFLLYSNLDAAHVEQVITEEVAYFESIGHDFEWKVYSHDNPPDLVERLRAHGFIIEDEETILVLDMNGLSGVLARPITHDIRRVHDPDQVGALMAAQAVVFGDDDFQPRAQRLKWELSQHPDYISLYAAYVENVLVASARIYFPTGSPFASLWGGGTLSAYRGRGVYTALVAARAQEALARGRRFLTIDASPMSRPIVEKLGFVAISTSRPCRWVRTVLPGGDAGP